MYGGGNWTASATNEHQHHKYVNICKERFWKIGPLHQKSLPVVFNYARVLSTRIMLKV
jgi:hypothetical protein